MIIANPISGRGAAPAAAERVENVLGRAGHAVERCTTRARGDAGRFAAGAESGFDRIVVAGGDGTLNEVLNGLADPARIPIAFLALGTANMLARDLGLPRDPEAVATLVESDAIRRIDLGRIGKHRFLGNVGVGFDALVVERIARTRQGALGYRSYVIPIARLLVGYRAPELEVRIDDGEPLACGLVIASNLRNYGGLFQVSERARCDSGVLEVCVFERAGMRDLVRYGIAGMLARLSKQAGVAFHSARRVRVAGGPAPVQVDGDTWGTTPVDLEIEPAAASILVPERAGPRDSRAAE